MTVYGSLGSTGRGSRQASASSKNSPLCWVLLLVLQRFGRRQWGHIFELTTENHSVSLYPINPDGTLGGDEVEVNFYPDGEIHSSWTLLGRATAVIGANRNEGNSGTTEGELAKVHGGAEGDFVRAASRKGSGNMQRIWGDAGKVASRAKDSVGAGAYFQARSEFREARGEIVGVHGLVLEMSWPGKSRLEEWRVIKRTQALGEGDEFIRGHILEVKCARDLDRYSTRHIRRFLGLDSDGCSGARTLRLIVMNRLRPIHDLDGECFWKTFWQCFACKCVLYILPSNPRPCHSQVITGCG